MKKLFTLLVLLLSFSTLFAQQTYVALLNHEGTITTYYGIEALTQAHDAAVHGDVITLSGGIFTAPTWTKAVTLRGVGCYEGKDGNREVTSISNRFILALSANIEKTVTIEGIKFNSDVEFSTSSSHFANNSIFLKCYFGKISSVLGNSSFYNCIIASEITFYGANLTNVNLFNCYVNDPHHPNYSNISVKFTNCNVRFSSTYQTPSSVDNGHRVWEMNYAKYSNCIFLGNIWNSRADTKITDFDIPTNCSATNCLSCYCAYQDATETEKAPYDYDIFDEMSNTTNKYLEKGKPIAETITSVFKTYNGTDDFTFHELYELTDEAKALYIGSDDTQVGIYGGIGFDLVPSTLQITKCEVSPRSTADGKLSVSIEIGIPE